MCKNMSCILPSAFWIRGLNEDVRRCVVYGMQYGRHGLIWVYVPTSAPGVLVKILSHPACLLVRMYNTLTLTLVYWIGSSFKNSNVCWLKISKAFKNLHEIPIAIRGTTYPAKSRGLAGGRLKLKIHKSPNMCCLKILEYQRVLIIFNNHHTLPKFVR